MATEWIGVINTTAQKFLQGAADNTMRERLLLALLKKHGRISYNESSYKCTWSVEFDQQPVEAYGDAGVIDFARSDLYRQLSHDWRGYVATDMMTEKERLMNKGNVAIINRYNAIMPTLMKSMQDHFCAELFIDGNLAGNENRLHGLESFFGVGTVAAGDRIAQPSDTYGDRSTALQSEGGSWSADLTTKPNSTIATDWPDGKGDVPYDFLSPKMLNYSSTAWGTGSTAWEDNCERVLRQARIWLTRTGGKQGSPTCYLMSGDLFYGYTNKQEAKQRIIVPHREAEDLGFTDVFNQDGVMIAHDFDVQAGLGYALNVYQMELASLSGQLFTSKGPKEDIRTDSWLFKVGFFGNARYNTKYFGKFAAYA